MKCIAVCAIAGSAFIGLTGAALLVDSDSTPPGAATLPEASEPAKPHLPALSEIKPHDLRGLHNVVAFYDGYWSGSVPEGDEGFQTLAAMGVKTIISVDGAEPGVDKAKAFGIRYIHLPIGYNGFDETRKLELARASRDALKNGSVYIHCHHGKHRSAGAAGAVAASLGWLTPEQAVDRMKVSGTAPNYKGLYSCAAKATPLDEKTIDAVSASFSEVSHPPTFVKSMIEIDEINDHLKAIEKAGWTVPKDHPDLVPAAEAGRMADLLRLAVEGDKAKAKPADFALGMMTNGEQVQTLEDLLAAGEKDCKKLSEQFKLIQASCKDCHVRFRD